MATASQKIIETRFFDLISGAKILAPSKTLPVRYMPLREGENQQVLTSRRQ